VAAGAALHVAHGQRQLLQPRRQVQRVRQQRQARGGGHDAARAALQQRRADVRLELGDALAGGGQRQLHALGAGGQAAAVHRGGEQPQRDEVEAVQVDGHGANPDSTPG
jgi:sRNA-binding protein